MLLKWMVCQISDSARTQFSHAQSHWWALTWVPGFLGQLGGWDQGRPRQVCILSIWQNLAYYEHFMREIHDGLMAVNKQAHTYNCLEVALFHSEISLRGTEPDLYHALLKACCLRIDDCSIYPDRISHFESVQQRIWKPAIEVAPGMLGGRFSQSLANQQRFLSLSLWSSYLHHGNYALNEVPELRIQAKEAEDVEASTGRLLSLETDWCVLPAEQAIWQET